ncbi:MAG: type 4a pilus biogenesis protein PilO [Candidatus Schekmanbacteria bacterium]|nr:type 4a pilus biogenesis protein PilO [Candidatus Schekmanbacteria bacterium]
MALELKLDFMFTLPKWQKYTILGVTALLILISYLWWFYFPLSEAIDKASKEKDVLSSKVATLDRMKGEIEKFKKENAQLQVQYLAQTEILPPSEELPNLLNSIVDISKQFNIKIKSFTPAALTQGQYYNEMKIAINVEGAYKDISLFVDSIRKMKRIVNIENLSLTEPVQKEGTIVLKGAMSLRIFSRS